MQCSFLPSSFVSAVPFLIRPVPKIFTIVGLMIIGGLIIAFQRHLVQRI